MNSKNHPNIKTDLNDKETISPQIQELLAQFTSEEHSLSISGQASSEDIIMMSLMKQMDSTHITQLLVNGHESEKRHSFIKIVMVSLGVFAGIIFLGMLIGALWIFQENPESSQLISDIFKYLLGAISGFFGGYGIRSFQSS